LDSIELEEGSTVAPPKSVEWDEDMAEPDMVLELADGLALAGNSFGAEGKSIAGECVFQTGESGVMVVFCR
jgi:carbamoyl-phosphate synthase/aspartate carbamoyltransferase